MKRIYMDNGATTRVTEPVFEAMQPYFCEIYGNPSSAHNFGYVSRHAIDAAREQVAKAINADVNEIYFTGCGTESDNWAVRGAAYENLKKGRHIITTAIEHHAILHTCAQLEKEGFEVTYLPVDEYGFVTPEQLDAAIRPDTTLVSIMTANNEIGTIEPIAELAAVCKKRGVLFDSARGSRNWSAEVARTAFAQGFTPDVITDDLTCLSNDPQTSRLHVHMGECMAMGMTLEEVLYRATNVPASYMKGVQVGIRRGMPANITILDIKEGPHMYTDAFGVNYEGNTFMLPVTTIVGGEVKYNTIETDY